MIVLYKFDYKINCSKHSRANHFHAESSMKMLFTQMVERQL